MGYAKGMLDLIIFESSRHYNGLCIEFKSVSGKGILSEHQKSIIVKSDNHCFSLDVILSMKLNLN